MCELTMWSAQYIITTTSPEPKRHQYIEPAAARCQLYQLNGRFRFRVGPQRIDVKPSDNGSLGSHCNKTWFQTSAAIKEGVHAWSMHWVDTQWGGHGRRANQDWYGKWKTPELAIIFDTCSNWNFTQNRTCLCEMALATFSTVPNELPHQHFLDSGSGSSEGCTHAVELNRPEQPAGPSKFSSEKNEIL